LKKKRKLNCLDEDLKEVERNQHAVDSTFALTQINYRHIQFSSSTNISRSLPRSFVDEARL
jgi:uncharacterized membrane protein